MIKIEKNIPVPARNSSRQLFPYADMMVGDSFHIPTTVDSDKDTGRRLRGTASAFSRKSAADGVRFSIRKMDNGYRVWRVA